jgi:hypothetical protein
MPEPDRLWTTRELLAWSHPHADWGTLDSRRNRCQAIRRAADKVAERVGLRRGRGGGILWRAKPGVFRAGRLIALPESSTSSAINW